VAWASRKAVIDAGGGTSDHPLIGMQIFENFRHIGESRWAGSVFVPDIGRRFSGTLTVIGPDVLEVRGCVLGRLICRSQDWQRFGARPVPPADVPQALTQASLLLSGTWTDAWHRSIRFHVCGGRLCGTVRGACCSSVPETIQDFAYEGGDRWVGSLYTTGGSAARVSLTESDPTHLKLKFCRFHLFCVTRWYSRS
jgi:uncharacterized protein (DUF2147 family)